VLPHGLHQSPPDTVELESALSVVEQAIATLGHTLTLQDPNAVEAAAGDLQVALRGAMERFAQVARRGTMPPALRRRLAMASGQVAAQREALFRATTALDQALDILIPQPEAAASVYSAYGSGNRGTGRVIAAS
jgi:alkylation response protein AidB-like acyl-CoA dehydrogenase